MKRVIFTVIAIMFLWVTCACATDGTKIHNGVVLGMSPAEVLALEQKNGVLYNSREYLESTLLEQPYTLLFFSNATDDTESAHYETYGKQLVEMQNGQYMDFELVIDYTSVSIAHQLRIQLPDQQNPWDLYGVNTEYTISPEDADRYLIQVHAMFNADQYYKTSKETFEDVERQLETIYGATRYTTRRGESLPLYKGWKGNATALSVMPITELESLGYSVPLHTHRVAKIDYGKYMIIDHHILIHETEEETTFTHEIVYTLIPWDISGGYAVDCMK